jgi:hypothetical protein
MDFRGLSAVGIVDSEQIDRRNFKNLSLDKLSKEWYTVYRNSKDAER